MVKIVVIGAGVVGLSTAVNIQRVLPGSEVKVVADKFFDETTSMGAMGIFLPTTIRQPGVPPETLKRWSEKSWRFYSKMATSDQARFTGHMVSPGYLLFKEKIEIPLYASIVYSFREMTRDEMDKLGFDNSFRFGYCVTTIITNMRKYVPWLMTKFKEHGGYVEKKKISSLKEGDCDVVVNCAGLGNQQLCDDRQMYPVYGQVVRVEMLWDKQVPELMAVHAPWLRHFVYAGDICHILPSDDFTALGGVKIKDRHSTTPDPKITQGIMSRCQELWPAIKGAKIVGEWAGLRPTRRPLRLEKEVPDLPTGQLMVVHNYGHGSNGGSLSWGTAEEAAGLVLELLSTSTKPKL